MNLTSLARNRPVPSLASAVFAIALLVTGAYFAGLVPGIPKSLPTFIDMVQVTIGLFVLAGLAWAVSLTVR